MNLLKFIPIKLTFLLVLGILIGYFFDIGIEFPILLTLVFLSVLGLLLFKEKETIGISFGIIAAFTTIVLGILIVAMAQPKNTDAHYSNILPNQQESWKIKVTEVLKSNSFSERYFAEVAEYNSYKASGKIILNRAIDSTF